MAERVVVVDPNTASPALCAGAAMTINPTAAPSATKGKKNRRSTPLLGPENYRQAGRLSTPLNGLFGAPSPESVRAL
jgi:hypothetical protein